MRPVSTGFIGASLSPVGYANAYVTINGNTINASKLKEITIQENIGESGAFSIGSFNTSEISLSVLTSALPNLVTGVPINAYFGYYVSGSYEYVPMGTFYAQPKDVTTQGLFTTIRGYDKSIRLTDTYTSSLNWNNTHTVAQVLSEIQTATSISMGSYGGLAPGSVTVYEKPKGTHRDVIMQMAILMGTNAKLNRTGSLDFIKAYPSTPVQEYGAYNYSTSNFQLTSNSPISFGRLTVNYTHTVSGEEVTDTFNYTAGSGSNTITLETVNVRTQAKTNTLGQAIYGSSGLSYYGYNATLPGQPQIDLGDTIRIEDVFGNEYDLLVLSANHIFNGAIKTTFSAVANEQDPSLDGDNMGTTLTEQVSTINDAASYAVGKAEYAATKADEASASAAQAAQSASAAAQSASQASASASSASQSATSAATSASNAETSARSAAASASSAAADAESANYYANSALTELGIVEDVIGTLDWISQHATYKASTDTTVVGGKYYFTRSGTAPNYTYTVVTNPTGNPSAQHYYEIDSIDEAVSNYVGTHLALTNEGLWVQNDSNAYKILLSSTGMKVYDPQGALVSTFGESITFSANRVQTIGNNNCYVTFNPANGGTLTIGGATIQMGSQTLDQVLNGKANTSDLHQTEVSVYPTAVDWSAGTATLAVTLRVDGTITTPTSYRWTKNTSTTSLGTGSTLSIDGTTNTLNDVYNCTVTW